MAEDIVNGASEHHGNANGVPSKTGNTGYTRSASGTAAAALVSSPNAKSKSAQQRLRRGERAFIVLFAPLCVAAFFAARSIGQQLKAGGYAEGIQSTYDMVVEMIPSAIAIANDEATDMGFGEQSHDFGVNSNASSFKTVSLSRRKNSTLTQS